LVEVREKRSRLGGKGSVTTLNKPCHRKRRKMRGDKKKGKKNVHRPGTGGEAEEKKAKEEHTVQAFWQSRAGRKKGRS